MCKYISYLVRYVMICRDIWAMQKPYFFHHAMHAKISMFIKCHQQCWTSFMRLLESKSFFCLFDVYNNAICGKPVACSLHILPHVEVLLNMWGIFALVSVILQIPFYFSFSVSSEPYAFLQSLNPPNSFLDHAVHYDMATCNKWLFSTWNAARLNCNVK